MVNKSRISQQGDGKRRKVSRENKLLVRRGGRNDISAHVEPPKTGGEELQREGDALKKQEESDVREVTDRTWLMEQHPQTRFLQMHNNGLVPLNKELTVKRPTEWLNNSNCGEDAALRKLINISKRPEENSRRGAGP